MIYYLLFMLLVFYKFYFLLIDELVLVFKMVKIENVKIRVLKYFCFDYCFGFSFYYNIIIMIVVSD